MKKILYGTFFAKPIYIELADSDDEDWFKKRMLEYQNHEMKEKEEYNELKIKEGLDYIHGK